MQQRDKKAAKERSETRTQGNRPLKQQHGLQKHQHGRKKKVGAVQKEKIASKHEKASVPQMKDKCTRSNSSKKTTNTQICRNGRTGRRRGGNWEPRSLPASPLPQTSFSGLGNIWKRKRWFIKQEKKKGGWILTNLFFVAHVEQENPAASWNWIRKDGTTSLVSAARWHKRKDETNSGGKRGRYTKRPQTGTWSSSRGLDM